MLLRKQNIALGHVSSPVASLFPAHWLHLYPFSAWGLSPAPRTLTPHVKYSSIITGFITLRAGLPQGRTSVSREMLESASLGPNSPGGLFHCIFQTFPTPREDWTLVVLMSNSLINIIFIKFSVPYFPQVFTSACQDYIWENPNCGHLSHQWYFLLAVVSITSWVNEQVHRNKLGLIFFYLN